MVSFGSDALGVVLRPSLSNELNMYRLCDAAEQMKGIRYGLLGDVSLL